MKRAQPARSGAERCHPLFARSMALEANHRTSEEGRALCEQNTDLAPGHNCCAVCAGGFPQGPPSATRCPRCCRVNYCCEEHKQKDAGRHGRVCTLLAAIETAEEAQISSEEDELLISEFLAAANAGALENGSSWHDVVPSYLAPLLGKKADEEAGESEEGAEAEAERPPSKRQRSHTDPEQAEEEEMRLNEASMKAMAEQAREEHMDGEVPYQTGLQRELQLQDSEYEGDAMHDAACLALASSVLTFPYTLYYTLRDCAPIALSALQAQDEGRPLVITILGAHDEAELARMNVWKVLEGAAGPGVPIVLQFVGLNVPSWIHKQQEQLSRTITAAYYQGDYQQLADEVLGSSKSRRPSGSVAISAASLAAQCAAAAAAASHSRAQQMPPTEHVGGTPTAEEGAHTRDKAPTASDAAGRASEGNINAAEPATGGGAGTSEGGVGSAGCVSAGGSGSAGAGPSGCPDAATGTAGAAGTAGTAREGSLWGGNEDSGMTGGGGGGAEGEGFNGGGSAASPLPFGLAALPDVIVGFNCGLSCEDYDWLGTFRALRRFYVAKHAAAAAGASEQRKPRTDRTTTSALSSSSSSESAQPPLVRMPWLLTANTRLEALFDADIVSDHLWEWSMPIHPNPFVSLEPLQSGTLANDVYRKNAWMAIYEMKPASATEVEGNKGRAAALKTIRRGLRRGLKNLGNRAGQLVGRVAQAGRSLLPRLGLSWGQNQ